VPTGKHEAMSTRPTNTLRTMARMMIKCPYRIAVWFPARVCCWLCDGVHGQPAVVKVVGRWKGLASLQTMSDIPTFVGVSLGGQGARED
jgi:hypothetical protein